VPKRQHFDQQYFMKIRKQSWCSESDSGCSVADNNGERGNSLYIFRAVYFTFFRIAGTQKRRKSCLTHEKSLYCIDIDVHKHIK